MKTAPPTIYTATTPTELREAVVDLCFLALALNDWHDGHFGKVLETSEIADVVVPPVPTVPMTWPCL
jgi:hypothetical protein